MSRSDRLGTVLGRLAQGGTVRVSRLAYAAQCGDSEPIAAQSAIARVRAAGVAPRRVGGLAGTSEGDDFNGFNLEEKTA